MSFSGARGIVAASRNSECELLSAMVADRVEDINFFQSYSDKGEAYTGEYGERQASIRRGQQFERTLYAAQEGQSAYRLRQAVGSVLGYSKQDIASMDVLDLRNAGGNTVEQTMELRLSMTREVLERLSRGLRVPQLLIQPQLSIPLFSGDTRYIAPDALLLDPGEGMYVPLEIKSHIVRRNTAERASQERARLQAAVEVIALSAEVERFGLAERVSSRALFIFATPRGLVPTEPYIEYLYAEITQVLRGVAALRRVAQRLAQLRGGARNREVPLAGLSDRLATNYLDRCKSICTLATICKGRAGERSAVLGDAARALLGADAQLWRLSELIDGALPKTTYEAALSTLLQGAAATLGYSALMPAAPAAGGR